MDAERLKRLFDAAPLHRPEDATGFLLWRVAHRYQREIDRAMGELDLTHLQFVVLVLSAWLSREGEVTQASIANFGGIHPMQLSIMLKTLEQKGLIERVRSTSDVRAKIVSPTLAGLQVLEKAIPVASAVQDRFFGMEGGESLHSSLRSLVGGWGEEK